MNLLDRRRQQIQWNIMQNPISINVNRTQKIEIDGHFDEKEIEVGPYTVRIFRKSQVNPKEISKLGGTKQTDEGWGLLADYMADIKAGPNVHDKFEVPTLGCFTVTAVHPQVLLGQIVGYQADLEKVE